MSIISTWLIVLFAAFASWLAGSLLLVVGILNQSVVDEEQEVLEIGVY